MGKFELMALPYAIDALEPVISRQTLEFHHGKHLAAYVNNLNALLPGSGFEEASLEEIVCKATGGILNNAGQILNHELYFGNLPHLRPTMLLRENSLRPSFVTSARLRHSRRSFRRRELRCLALAGYGYRLTRMASL